MFNMCFVTSNFKVGNDIFYKVLKPLKFVLPRLLEASNTNTISTTAYMHSEYKNEKHKYIDCL